MEEKLESYRLRKRRTEKFQSLKEVFFKMVSINISSNDKKVEVTNVNIEVQTMNLWQYQIDNKSSLNPTEYR